MVGPGARRVWLAFWLVAGSLAGCLGSDDGRSDGPDALAEACLERGRSASGNAPLFDALRTDPADLARRLAEAVDDPLADQAPNRTRSTDDRLRWDTQGGGTVTYDRPSQPTAEGFGRISWQGPDRWRLTTLEATEDRVREILSDIGIPGDVPLQVGWNSPDQREEAWFSQVADGSTAGATGGLVTSYSYGDGFSIEGLHDLSEAARTYPRPQAQEHAERYMRCALDDQGATEEAGYEQTSISYEHLEVARQSLSYRFLLRYTEPAPPSHCGLARYVDVDAETGAILAARAPVCA